MSAEEQAEPTPRLKDSRTSKGAQKPRRDVRCRVRFR